MPKTPKPKTRKTLTVIGILTTTFFRILLMLGCLNVPRTLVREGGDDNGKIATKAHAFNLNRYIKIPYE